jgi:hypothetical protein
MGSYGDRACVSAHPLQDLISSTSWLSKRCCFLTPSGDLVIERKIYLPPDFHVLTSFIGINVNILCFLTGNPNHRKRYRRKAANILRVHKETVPISVRKVRKLRWPFYFINQLIYWNYTVWNKLLATHKFASNPTWRTKIQNGRQIT